MDHFRYIEGELFGEGVRLTDLADAVGTPTYVYSTGTIVDHYDKLESAFKALKPLICFSLKSCSNLHIAKLLVQRGAGMDVVSGGELHRSRLAGCPDDRVVYAGVGKTAAEIAYALGLEGRGELVGAEPGKPIRLFNVESEPEFELLASVAEHHGAETNAALRVNPDVDPKTHRYTTTGKRENKFGVDIDRAREVFERYGANKHVRLSGLHVHIGSPVYDTAPYVQAIERVLELIDELASDGHEITTLDLGGGFGADYETGRSPAAKEYADAIEPLLADRVKNGLQIILEPGRTIMGNAGVLLTRVQFVKDSGEKKFVICDAGMHTLIRPALYEAFHFIWPVKVDRSLEPQGRAAEMDLPGLELCDVVGPICESADFLGLGRKLPPVKRGDLLAVFTAGAYGFTLSSRYNGHPSPAEVLIHGGDAQIVRRRETVTDLVEHEMTPKSV